MLTAKLDHVRLSADPERRRREVRVLLERMATAAVNADADALAETVTPRLSWRPTDRGLPW